MGCFMGGEGTVKIDRSRYNNILRKLGFDGSFRELICSHGFEPTFEGDSLVGLYLPCPHFPSHHAFLLDFPAICIGRSLPFFVGCHSAARLGFTVTRSLTPSTTCLFEQWGHPIPLLLFPITASHSCPHVPFHQTFRLDPAVTCVGRRQLFFVGCHSAAKSGLTVARSF